MTTLESRSDRSDARDDGSEWSSSSGAPRRKALPKKPVYFNTTPKVVKEFKEAYGFEPILRTSEPIHGHPHLAYQRNTLEMRAAKLVHKDLAPGYLVDVGSAAARVRHHYGGPFHCMAPNLHPGDLGRIQENRRQTGPDYHVCGHILQECDCPATRHFRWKALLLTHSAYYIPVEDLASAITRTSMGCAFVVGHLFPEALGHMGYEEAQWKFVLNKHTRTPDVVMAVVGNAHQYRHPVLPWQHGLEYCRGLDWRLDVELVERLGDTYLWCVRVDTNPPPLRRAPDVGFETVLVDHNHVGPITIPANYRTVQLSNTANDLVVLDIDTVNGFGSVLWLEQDREAFFVPRGVISHVAMQLAGKHRTAALWSDAYHYARQALVSARIGPDDKRVALPYIVAMAFNINLQHEINAALSSQQRFSPWWSVHAALNSLDPIVIFRWRYVVLALIVAALLVAAYWFVPVPHAHLTAAILAGAVVFVVAVVFIVRCCYRRRQRETLEYWKDSGRVQVAASVLGALRYDHVAFPGSTDLVAPLLGSGTLTVRPPDRDEPEPGRVERLHAVGPVVSDVRPNIHEPSAAADVAALTNRVLVEPLPVDPDALRAFNDPNAAINKFLETIRVEPRPDDFERWVMQPKFSEATRVAFRRAYEKVKDQPPPGLVKYGAFTKLEKDKWVSLLAGAPALKPRIISAPETEAKVMTGPYISRLQKAVADLFNNHMLPYGQKIVYASGLTPDQLGAYVDGFIGEWGSCVGISNDFSCYDSTLRNELLASEEAQDVRMGMDATTLGWLSHESPTVVTRHGVIATLEDHEPGVPGRVMRSGRASTNMTDTKVNARAHATGLPPTLPFLMLVNGDDNFLLIPQARFSEELVSNLMTHLTGLGLRPTPIVSANRCEWEFCSRLFWYATDPTTGSQVTVLGPKPGRLLARLGWRVNSPLAPNFRGVVLSLRDDCAHVPILGPALAALDALTASHRVYRGREWEELKHVSRRFAPHPENRRLVEERYGFTEEVIAEIEAKYTSLKSVRTVIKSEHLDAMFQRDL